MAPQDEFLKGSRYPTWTCGQCQIEGNYQTRLTCRKCQKLASGKQQAIARAADSAARAAAKPASRSTRSKDAPGSPTQRSEAQKLRKQLEEAQRTIKELRAPSEEKSGTSAVAVVDVKSPETAEIEKYEAAIAGFGAEDEWPPTIAKVAAELRAGIEAAKKRRDQAKPDATRRQDAVLRRKRLQESVAKGTKAVLAAEEELKSALEKAEQIRSRADDLRKKRAENEVAIVALDAEIAHLSTVIVAAPGPEQYDELYKDLPDFLRERSIATVKEVAAYRTQQRAAAAAAAEASRKAEEAAAAEAARRAVVEATFGAAAAGPAGAGGTLPPDPATQQQQSAQQPQQSTPPAGSGTARHGSGSCPD